MSTYGAKERRNCWTTSNSPAENNTNGDFRQSRAQHGRELVYQILNTQGCVIQAAIVIVIGGKRKQKRDLGFFREIMPFV